MERKIHRGEVTAWAIYDLANTIFSMSIITFFLPQWIIHDQGLPDLAFQIPFSISMLLVGLTTPYLGAVADERGDHLRPLRWLTILSVSVKAISFLSYLVTQIVNPS